MRNVLLDDPDESGAAVEGGADGVLTAVAA